MEELLEALDNLYGTKGKKGDALFEKWIRHSELYRNVVRLCGKQLFAYTGMDHFGGIISNWGAIKTLEDNGYLVKQNMLGRPSGYLWKHNDERTVFYNYYG